VGSRRVPGRNLGSPDRRHTRNQRRNQSGSPKRKRIFQLVNITLITGRGFDWHSENHIWNDVERAAIFARFWSLVDRADATACWPWRGYVATNGYGVFSIGRLRVRAHRFSWMASRGPIPAGKEVCHRCDNAACINPGHLFIGSHQDNHLDSVRKGRKRAWGLQKLDAAQVLAIRALAHAGVLQRSIAAQYGISRNHVSSIVTGKVWTHLPVSSDPCLQIGASAVQPVAGALDVADQSLGFGA
jgi:hypothetical protein